MPTFHLLLPVTLATAGALAILLIVLAVQVIRQRQAQGILFGDGPDDGPLQQRARAHANLTEYAPLVLILMAGLELAGSNRTFLAVIGAGFVVVRVLHAAGMRQSGPNLLRMIGIGGTALVLAVLAITALLAAFR